MFRRTSSSWPSYPKEVIDLPPAEDSSPIETSEANDSESFMIVGEKLSYSNIAETPSIFAPAVDSSVKPTTVPPENPSMQQMDEELSLNAQELSRSILEDLPSSPDESGTTEPSAACNEPANQSPPQERSQQVAFDQDIFNLVPPEDEEVPINETAESLQSSSREDIPRVDLPQQQQPSADCRFEGLSVIAESLAGEPPKVTSDETPLPSPPQVVPPKKAKKLAKPTDPALLMCCGTAFAVFFLGGSILSMSTISDPIVMEDDIPNMGGQEKTTSQPVPKSPETPAAPPTHFPSPAPAPKEEDFKNEENEEESADDTFDFDEPDDAEESDETKCDFDESDDAVPPADSTDENGFSWIRQSLVTLVFGVAGVGALSRSSGTGTDNDESPVNVNSEGKSETRVTEPFESRRITRSMAKSLKQEIPSSTSSSSRCDQLRCFLLECRTTLHRTGYKKGQGTHKKYNISNYDKLTKEDLLKVIHHLDCPQRTGNKHTLVVALVDAYAALLSTFKKYEIEGLLKVKGVGMPSKTKKDAMIQALVEAGF